MGRRVGIVGAAVTPFKSKWYEKTYYELAQMATRDALKDAGITAQEVDAVVYGIYNDIFERTCIPEHPLQAVIGMQNKPGVRISNGGATGAYAMSVAHAYIAAGRYDTAMVLGVEKATDCFDFTSMSSTPEVIKVIGWSGDSFFEQKIGWTAADSYAEVVLAYMDRYPGDLKPEITAKVSALLSEQVKTNRYAQRQFDQCAPAEVMNSRYIVYPFKELEICVYSEGAAAVIFAEENTAKAIAQRTGQPVVWITGVGEANEVSFAGKNLNDWGRIKSHHVAANMAYKMAGITNPLKEIDVVEIHDAFIHQLEITMAEMGFVPHGKADSLIEDGLMTPGGEVSVNPSGGLIYCGHAVGASNIMSAWSCRNEMIEKQYRRGLVHGTGSTIAQYGVVMILEHE
ncbi:MAG: thiolase family protein [Acidobacteria bacterium]|nr:thiolase family protein [Acidobacteriota bacterium]MBI3658542.1 thiolase family protein [Acidobacteriota bacterium]